MQKAEVGWHDGDVPVSRRFDEPFSSAADGLSECAHVYLAGNHLPERFAAGFLIAELGFGTGLNALTAARGWREAGRAGDLIFTSFEARPMAAADMRRAVARWPELDPWAEPLATAWATGSRELELPGCG
jgi:tRNA U34 5-methylaminomethyl-2-thiouridine-forming methyltransferase MnmC